MTVRGATTPQERIFGALPYLLPMAESLIFGSFFFQQFPEISAVLLLVLSPVLALYGAFPLMGLIIFFALFMLVVRNESLPHFIRFNTMQAIMIMICISVCRILIDFILSPLLGITITSVGVSVAGPTEFLVEILFNFIFFGVFAASIYSIVQVLRGHYPDDIPSLSEIVYMQVR